MKTVTNLKPIYPALTVFLLSAFCFLPSALSAQTDENIILDSAFIQKNELKITPKITEKLLTDLKNMPEKTLSYFGINQSQLENLQIGKLIPCYNIVNEELDSAFLTHIVTIYNVSRMADGAPLSLRFANTWNVPVMSDETPLLFGLIRSSVISRDLGLEGINGDPHLGSTLLKNTIEHFHHYEHKDSIIGSLGVTPLRFGMDFLIIKKENKVLFVQVYDEATGEFFKNEYSFSELINPIKEISLREKEARERSRDRYYAYVADKRELILTPELTEMLLARVYKHIENWSEEILSSCGIENKPKLENLHPGKPVPRYSIVNENLTFTGYWDVPIMSDGKPFYTSTVKLEDNGQYSYARGGTANYEALNNYKYKNLIIGYLRTGNTSYLIIRKDNTDIYVKPYDEATGEYFKNEYSLSDIINLSKK